MSGEEEEEISGESGGGSRWSREEDKAFENGIATYSSDDPDRWNKIAGDVPGKSADEIKRHYEILVDDVAQIDSGRVAIPSYENENENENENESSEGSEEGKKKKKGSQLESKARSDQERRKGIAWTEDEHRLFLLGLDKYGKGDWRSISRNFVVTRTPTQVASHAQKYFIRLNSINKDRRRSSIHDITSVANADCNSSDAATSAAKQQPLFAAPAVGTPVVAQPQMAYALPAPYRR